MVALMTQGRHADASSSNGEYMQSVSRGGFVPFFTAWAAVLLVACANRASCQELNAEPGSSQQLMHAGGMSAEKEISLGNDYLSGHGVGKDEKQAAFWYEKAAEAGDPWAQQQIGFFYQAGIGVMADPARAAHWYQLAAASGLATAKRNLGVAYLWGAGVPMDKALAAQLFREAANKGDGLAATYLGNLYCMGQGVKQDKTEAERWYMTAARRRDPTAYFELGTLLSTDAHDFAKAAEWLRKSIDRGYVPAMHTLAVVLAEHPELARSDHEALSLFEEASKYGQWRSSEALGILHRDGRSVPCDPKAAYYYFQLAVLQGGETARRLLEYDMQRLSSELGARETTAAAAEAQAWYQDHHDAVEFLLNKMAKNTPPGLAIVTPEEGIHAGQLITIPPS